MENNKKDNIFKIVNDKNEEIECRILFTFDSEETGKSYIVYTDDKIGEDGRPLAYASIFDSTGESDDLKPIEDEKEWDLIFSVYESLQEKEEENNNEEE